MNAPLQTESANAPSRRAYFPELDGVRAIAIAMVMVFHLASPAIPIPGPTVLGQTGVDLFFVLSGFLITGILLKSPQRDWLEVRVFYLRRALRIFPLYYATLLVVWLGIMHDHVSWDVWIYLQNLVMTFGGWMRGPSHFWSLAVEEQFYLVWPFLVLFLPRRYLGKVLCGMIVAAVLSRVVLLHAGLSTFYFTLSRVDALGAGALLALLQWRGQLARMRVSLLLVLAASGGVLALQTRLPGAYLTQLTKFTVLAAFYASGVGLVLLRVSPWLTRILASAPLRFIGRISYGLYVFHPFVFLYVERHTQGLAVPLRALLAVAGSFGLALLSWHGMENHFIRLKDRIAPERAQFPQTAPSATAL